MTIKKITITGAAGNICYSLIFRILSKSVFAQNTRIQLSLLDIKETMSVLQGIKYEVEDCAFEVLDSIIITDNPEDAFSDSDFILLIGAKPRSEEMERSDLLLENANIFQQQAKIINKCVNKNSKIIVVGNPANTNALIVQNFTPNVPDENITSLMKLDQNRAKNILASHVNKPVEAISKLVVWGNHSTTQYPNIFHSLINNQSATEFVDENWISKDFIPRIQNRGSEIIKYREKSSAASAASAIYDQLDNIVNGSNDWESMGILSSGQYNVAPDIFFSFPIDLKEGKIHLIDNLDLNEFSLKYIKESADELISEREVIKDILNN